MFFALIEKWRGRIMAETFRAERKVYTAFFFICAVPGLPAIVATYSLGHFRDFFFLILLFLTVFSFCCLWLVCYKITITNDSIVYTSLFGGTRSLRFMEISAAKERIGIFHYLDRFKPFWRLEIYPSEQIGKKPIVINVKVFGRDAISKVHTFLGTKLQ